MSEKTEALRLADDLEFAGRFGLECEQEAARRRVSRNHKAAAALRKLHAECEALRADAAQAVRSERSRCLALAKLAISYAVDADWSRVDVVIGLIERPAAMAKEQTK